METECEKQLSDETISGSCHNHADSIVFEFNESSLFWLILNIILMVFIICGNLLTIAAVRICRRLRAIISNLFVLSLAVSDLIVGLTVPYHTAFYLSSGLGQSHIFCLLKFYIMIFACSISVWNLISIAVDRYIAIVYPLHYRRFITRRKVMIIIALGWIIGSSLACIPIFWNHWQTAAECEFDQILPAWYLAGIITPSFITIWICMLLVYWRIWKEASKQAKQLRKSTCCQIKDAPSDWKSVQVVLLIMGGFTICWLPYFVVACGQIFDSYESSPALYKGALALAMGNSGLNPIIYAWKNSNFRKSFSLLLRCKSPNCINNNEYSVREPCHRNISLNQTQTAIEASGKPLSLPDGSVIQAQQPTTIIGCNTVPTNNPISVAAMLTNVNRNFLSELSATQLIYHSETNRNRLPIFFMMANESYMSSKNICPSCEICKLVLGKKITLGNHIKEALIPWKCGQYNNHIMNTIKCRW